MTAVSPDMLNMCYTDKPAVPIGDEFSTCRLLWDKILCVCGQQCIHEYSCMFIKYIYNQGREAGAVAGGSCTSFREVETETAIWIYVIGTNRKRQLSE